MSYYDADGIRVEHGDCLDVLRELADASVDAVVTDPPYGLEFMGKEWDSPWKQDGTVLDDPATVGGFQDGAGGNPYSRSRVRFGIGKGFQAWCQLWAAECLRVLKPGGHLLAFGGTRTSHRLTCAIEDAGFEIRDNLVWLYGSGFPKSLDVSKAIDKAADAKRDVVGPAVRVDGKPRNYETWAPHETDSMAGTLAIAGPPLTAPATDDARRWEGWGTALKPGHEPVVCAQKPFSAVSLDWRMVARVHHALAGLLWLSISPAKRAESSSPSSRAELGEGPLCVSALVRAATDTSPDESAATATFSSPATASTCLSIVSSWNNILAALSDPTTTSTTSTASSTTTGLRILSSLLGQVTSQNTMPVCECLLAGPRQRATSAANDSSDAWMSWLDTLTATAPETVGGETARAVALALASVAESCSSGQAAGSSAAQPATTHTATSTGNGTSGVTDESRPGHEPIVVARKPLAGTVAQTVLAWGTGALNVDGCRVEGEPWATVAPNAGGRSAGIMGQPRPHPGGSPHAAGRWPANVVLTHSATCTDTACVDGCPVREVDAQSGETASVPNKGTTDRTGHPDWRMTQGDGYDDSGGASRFFYTAKADAAGRWPANVVLSHSSACTGTACVDGCPVRELDAQSGVLTSGLMRAGTKPKGKRETYGQDAAAGYETQRDTPGDSGGASRFFYTAKADANERVRVPKAGAGEGWVTLGGKVRECNVCGSRAIDSGVTELTCGHHDHRWVDNPRAERVSHPTVKPLALMRWLVRLVTPPGGLILDPFAGSGTTVEAALLEGFRCIGIEREAEYLPLIVQRLNRRRDPVAYVKAAGGDGGLFDLLGEPT